MLFHVTTILNYVHIYMTQLFTQHPSLLYSVWTKMKISLPFSYFFTEIGVFFFKAGIFLLWRTDKNSALHEYMTTYCNISILYLWIVLSCSYRHYYLFLLSRDMYSLRDNTNQYYFRDEVITLLFVKQWE